jgi:cytidyltransferase-like protein
MTKIYVNVTCDLFHYGHISFFKKALDFGDYLIVGVCSDEEVAVNKWPPIMNLNERVAVIECCKFVNEVIPGVPFETTEKFIKEHQIDLVVATESYSKEVLNKFYKDPQKMNILKLVNYEEGISTSSVVERCAQLFNKRKKLRKKM